MPISFILARGNRHPKPERFATDTFHDQAGFERAMAALRPKPEQRVGVWRLVPIGYRGPYPPKPYDRTAREWKPRDCGDLVGPASWSEFVSVARHALASEFWTVLIHHIQFALAAHRALGLPIVAILDGDRLHNVAVRASAGRLMDLRGVLPDDMMAARCMLGGERIVGPLRFLDVSPEKGEEWLAPHAAYLPIEGFDAFMQDVARTFYADLPDAHLFVSPSDWRFGLDPDAPTFGDDPFGHARRR